MKNKTFVTRVQRAKTFPKMFCNIYYCAMHVVLARYCYRKSSVRLSVRDVDVPRVYMLN